MAATLVEGQKYGLDSNVSITGNKTFIHFKLTDPALRALEEYSKIKEGCSRKPTIQFTGSSGVITIPGQVSSEDPRAERRFQVTLPKMHGDANGSFDCIQQTRSRHVSGLNCLGSMQYKVITHANNEVYSDTRKKIAIADNESKKICAKEIKMSGRFSGKKIKKVIPSSQYKALNPAKPASLPPARHNSSSALTSTSTLSQSSSASSRLTTPPASTLSPNNPVSDSRPANKSTSLVSSNNGILKIGNSSGNKSSRAINMPYRDRVIHLLALRPYKKPELVYRLMKDGIHERDHESLGTLLKSISVMNKDNSYSLAKHAWQYVRADWPLYSDADKQLAKKNQLLVESRSSASPSISPAVQPSDSPSPPQKRASEDSSDTIPTKKQRIAHQDKHHSSHSKAKLPHGTLPLTKKTSHQYNHRTTGGSTGSLSNASDASDSISLLSSGVSDKDSPIPESPSSNCENQGKGDEQDSSRPDYVLQYGKIENCHQRLRYKEDFNKEYWEYRQLHEKVQNVSRRFEYLKERIDNTQEGSQVYEELRNKVLEEYKQQKSNTQFLQHKERVDYLHLKLGHIKRLIMDYDRDYHTSQCS